MPRGLDVGSVFALYNTFPHEYQAPEWQGTNSGSEMRYVTNLNTSQKSLKHCQNIYKCSFSMLLYVILCSVYIVYLFRFGKVA